MKALQLWLDDCNDPGTSRLLINGYNWIYAKEFLLDPNMETTAIIWARTAQEAIDVLATKRIDFASLDFDLSVSLQVEYSESPGSGLDVLNWMDENQIWPTNGVLCHSGLPYGLKLMNDRISRIKEKMNRISIESVQDAPGTIVTE